jgi:Ca2+-binding RTX toxin-like protein
MEGGAGSDIYHVDSLQDTIEETPAGGNDRIVSGITLNMALISQHVEQLYLTGSGDLDVTGNARDNLLLGNDGANTLAGANGGDLIFGAGGNDMLSGGSGNDRLVGGAGNDTLLGGPGIDSFVFSGAFGVDLIADFDTAEGDVIDFSGLAAITSWADLTAGHLSTGAGGWAEISVRGNAVTLQGVTVAMLSAGDFVF